jgi:uncharacterized RDD family membrane protein YckC/ribosomal protein L40E
MNVSLTCPACGHDNPADAGFCANCGSSLLKTPAAAIATGATGGATAAAPTAGVEPTETTQVRCQQCGWDNPPTASFCSNCGSSLNAADLSPTAESLHVEREATGPRAEYAGFWMRLGAAVLDTIIIWFGLTVFSAISFLLSSSRSGSTAAAGLLMSMITLVWPIAYYILFTGLRGQTLGKIVVRIRVVNEQGGVPGFGRAALRETIGKFVSTLAVGFGFLSIAWSKEKRGWHDIIAGTYVVKV